VVAQCVMLLSVDVVLPMSSMLLLCTEYHKRVSTATAVSATLFNCDECGVACITDIAHPTALVHRPRSRRERKRTLLKQRSNAVRSRPA
jgi:hypothetical protein